MEEGVGRFGILAMSRYSGTWYGKVARAEISNEYGGLAVWKKALGIRGIVRRFVTVEHSMGSRESRNN